LGEGISDFINFSFMPQPQHQILCYISQEEPSCVVSLADSQTAA